MNRIKLVEDFGGVLINKIINDLPKNSKLLFVEKIQDETKRSSLYLVTYKYNETIFTTKLKGWSSHVKRY